MLPRAGRPVRASRFAAATLDIDLDAWGIEVDNGYRIPAAPGQFARRRRPALRINPLPASNSAAVPGSGITVT